MLKYVHDMKAVRKLELEISGHSVALYEVECMDKKERESEWGWEN